MNLSYNNKDFEIFKYLTFSRKKFGKIPSLNISLHRPLNYSKLQIHLPRVYKYKLITLGVNNFTFPSSHQFYHFVEPRAFDEDGTPAQYEIERGACIPSKTHCICIGHNEGSLDGPIEMARN